MLSTEDIRTLNAARTILDRMQADCARHRRDQPKSFVEPDGHDYGRVAGAGWAAQDAIFHVLNELSSSRVQKIPDDLMYNREEPRARDIADVSVDTDEDGFLLCVSADGIHTDYRIGDGRQLLEAVKPIGAHWREGIRLAAEHQHDLNTAEAAAEAYAPTDPKHPTFLERMSEIADERP